MRNSLKHLTEDEKRQYYIEKAKKKYAEKVGRPVRKHETGLTAEQKKEKRRLKYLKESEGRKRQPDYSKMTADEKEKFLKERQKEYNKAAREKRLKENPIPKRKNLSTLTKEEKDERRKYNREAYRKKREKLGLPIRVYNKLTPEEKEKRELEKQENKRLRLERSIFLKEHRRLKRNEKEKLKRDKKRKTDSIKIGRPITNKNYVRDNELTYEIILSKGKGDPTEKLKMMLYKMVYNINRRFYYYDDDMRYDIMMETYISIMKNYKSYDEKKYNSSFSYITEIIKRSHTKHFHMESNKGIKVNPSYYSYDTIVGFVSTSEFDNF